MRCIEIYGKSVTNTTFTWLIETWDVLKYKQIADTTSRKWWLIETWDVLKLRSANCDIDARYRLIETWDVLKSDLGWLFPTNDVD